MMRPIASYRHNSSFFVFYIEIYTNCIDFPAYSAHSAIDTLSEVLILRNGRFFKPFLRIKHCQNSY